MQYFDHGDGRLSRVVPADLLRVSVGNVLEGGSVASLIDRASAPSLTPASADPATLRSPVEVGCGGCDGVVAVGAAAALPCSECVSTCLKSLHVSSRSVSKAACNVH